MGCKRIRGKKVCSKPRANWYKTQLGQDWYAGGTVDVETPIQQPYLLTASVRTETTETFTWIQPSILPTGYLIMAKANSAVDADPVDGTNYTADSAFGGGTEIGTGNFVVGKVLAGTTSLEITNLTAATPYHYRIVSFNGTGTNVKFRTLPEKGHLWQTQPTITSPGIGAAQKADGSVLIKTSDDDIYYSTDQGDTWILWATISGELFHCCEVCEGGTIHDSSGTPVAIKYIFASHSGTGNIYAGYVPGDVPELIGTGPAGETWNEVAWNSAISVLGLIADSVGGGNRLALFANARTAAYYSTLGSNSFASIAATPNSGNGIDFVAVAKNPAAAGFPFFTISGSTITAVAGPLTKNYHMVQFCPGLDGVDSRIVATSADDNGNDIVVTDDYFATYTEIAVTGAYGAVYYDPINKRACSVSREPDQPFLLSSTGLAWEEVDNPDPTAVWFNVLAPDDRFISMASSGTTLAAKTIPSNLQSATTRTDHYVTYRDNLPTPMTAGNAIAARDFFYAIDDIPGMWDRILCFWIFNLQAAKDSCFIDGKNPASLTFRLIESGTTIATTGEGIKSNGTTGCLGTGFISATHNTDVNKLSIFHANFDDVEATQFDYGVQGPGGSTQRISFNSHATDDTVASVAMNSASVASGANASSAARWANVANGATSADHDIYKNAVSFDASNATRTTRPSVELTLLAFNNNGTPSLFCTRNMMYAMIIDDGVTSQEVTTLDQAFQLLVPV